MFAGPATPMGQSVTSAFIPEGAALNQRVGEGGVPAALAAIYEALVKSDELLSGALNQLRGPQPEEAPRGQGAPNAINIMSGLDEILARARRVTGKAHELNQRLL